MKTLKEQIILRGQLEEITMMELRQHPGDIFNQVEMGKVFVITRNGDPIANLSRLPGNELIKVIGSDGKTNGYKNPERSWA